MTKENDLRLNDLMLVLSDITESFKFYETVEKDDYKKFVLEQSITLMNDMVDDLKIFNEIDFACKSQLENYFYQLYVIYRLNYSKYLSSMIYNLILKVFGIINCKGE